MGKMLVELSYMTLSAWRRVSKLLFVRRIKYSISLDSSVAKLMSIFQVGKALDTVGLPLISVSPDSDSLKSQRQARNVLKSGGLSA